MYLRMETVNAILQLPSPYIRRSGKGATFTIICTVNEGAACRFGGSVWTDQALTSFALDLVNDIDWKRIESASRKQVVIRYTSTGDSAHAEIDFGDGFIPLPLKPEGEP